jgi:hypothetical protein
MGAFLFLPRAHFLPHRQGSRHSADEADEADEARQHRADLRPRSSSGMSRPC